MNSELDLWERASRDPEAQETALILTSLALEKGVAGENARRLVTRFSADPEKALEVFRALSYASFLNGGLSLWLYEIAARDCDVAKLSQ